MSQEKQFYVYVHRYASGPKQGEVFYVGKGKGKRYKDKRRNVFWNRIVAKYGFTPIIVCWFKSEKCAFSFECALISFYGRERLCNLTDGGEGNCGYKASDETRLKISRSKTGIGHTDEAKKRISASLTGIKRSDETRLRMSKANSNGGNWIFGLNHSNETKRKMSESHERHPVSCSNGMKFKSINDATRWLKSQGYEKATSGNISHCIKGKCRIAYGFTWSYAEE